VKRLLSILFAIGLVLTSSLPANATRQNVEIVDWLNGCKAHYQFGTFLTVPYVWGEMQDTAYKCVVYRLRLAYAKGGQKRYKDLSIGQNSRHSYKYKLTGPAGWSAYGARVCFGTVDRYDESEIEFNVHLSIFEPTDTEASTRTFCSMGF